MAPGMAHHKVPRIKAFLDNLFSAWALSSLGIISGLAVEWYASLPSGVSSSQEFQSRAVGFQLEKLFSDRQEGVVFRILKADHDELERYEKSFRTWCSGRSLQANYDHLEQAISRHFQWRFLGLSSQVDTRSAKTSAWEELVDGHYQHLMCLATLDHLGLKGPKNKKVVYAIVCKEVLYQLSAMYDLDLALATPHLRVDGWSREFLEHKLEGSNLASMSTVPLARSELAGWFQVTVVSHIDGLESLALVKSIQAGSLSSSEVLSHFKGRFEALQGHWILYLHLFSASSWPKLNEYHNVSEQLNSDRPHLSCTSKFTGDTVTFDDYGFYSAMVSALTFMHWRANPDRGSLFFLSRLLALFLVHEQSLLKGLMSYASAIVLLDLSTVRLSLQQLLSGDILLLTEHFATAVRSVVDMHNLVNTLSVPLANKYLAKRKWNNQQEVGSCNLAGYLAMAVLPEVRKSKNSWKD